MEKIDNDATLATLVEDIDIALMKWMNAYELHGLNLSAIMLARLTWMAKMGNYREDWIQLLKSPEQVLNEQEENKDILH
jgi:hypothetical protein